MARTPCIRGPLPCQTYASGHDLHVIQAKLAGLSPRGWRDGVVTAVHGSDVTVQYVEVDHVLRFWHHRHLRLPTGQPVRVHERYHVAAGPFGWANVVVSNGPGAVPDPQEPALWQPEQSIPIVELHTGYSLPDEPA